MTLNKLMLSLVVLAFLWYIYNEARKPKSEIVKEEKK